MLTGVQVLLSEELKISDNKLSRILWYGIVAFNVPLRHIIGFILACVVRVKIENGRKFTHKK